MWQGQSNFHSLNGELIAAKEKLSQPQCGKKESSPCLSVHQTTLTTSAVFECMAAIAGNLNLLLDFGAGNTKASCINGTEVCCMQFLHLFLLKGALFVHKCTFTFSASGDSNTSFVISQSSSMSAASNSLLMLNSVPLELSSFGSAQPSSCHEKPHFLEFQQPVANFKSNASLSGTDALLVVVDTSICN